MWQVHKYIETGFNALLLLYEVMHLLALRILNSDLWIQLCEKQKRCRDAARSLVDEMDDFLKYRAEDLAEMLTKSEDTRKAFNSVAKAFGEITEIIKKYNKGMIVSLLRRCIIISILSITKIKPRGQVMHSLKTTKFN